MAIGVLAVQIWLFTLPPTPYRVKKCLTDPLSVLFEVTATLGVETVGALRAVPRATLEEHFGQARHRRNASSEVGVQSLGALSD